MVKQMRAKLRRSLLDAIRHDRAEDREEQDLLGDLLASQLNRRFGTWRVLRWHVYLGAGWFALGTWGPASLRFDPPPFLGGNLVMSAEAALASVVTLIAANAVMRALLQLVQKNNQLITAMHREHQVMHRDVRRALDLLEKRDV